MSSWYFMDSFLSGPSFKLLPSLNNFIEMLRQIHDIKLFPLLIRLSLHTFLNEDVNFETSLNKYVLRLLIPKRLNKFPPKTFSKLILNDVRNQMTF